MINHSTPRIHRHATKSTKTLFAPRLSRLDDASFATIYGLSTRVHPHPIRTRTTQRTQGRTLASERLGHGSFAEKSRRHAAPIIPGMRVRTNGLPPRLQSVLRHVQRFAGPCPVCGNGPQPSRTPCGKPQNEIMGMEAMNPINTPHTNAVLGAPAGWDAKAHGPCKGLPLVRIGDIHRSWWRVSFVDRIKILFGVPVCLDVISSGHPPVSLNVERWPEPNFEGHESDAMAPGIQTAFSENRESIGA